LVCVARDFVCFLRALEAQEGLGEVVATLEDDRVLQSINVDCGTSIVFNASPFGEFDTCDGAVREKCCIVRVLLDPISRQGCEFGDVRMIA
jgi:hypothetical protein